MHRDSVAIHSVLTFCFGETRPRKWFAKDPAFNGLMKQRFHRLTRRAIAGDLDASSADAPRALALVQLLDQFPCQIWRDTALAFAGDPPPQCRALGRVSGVEELAFLQKPGSRF